MSQCPGPLNTKPFVYDGVPLSPQLYAEVDSKLARIGAQIAQNESWLVRGEPGFDSKPLTVRQELTRYIYEACADVQRCRKDLKYEYLGLKDSWL